MKTDATKLLSGGLLPDVRALDNLPLGAKWRVQTVNLHHLALAQRDAAFYGALATATYKTADGWPVVSLLRAAKLPAERVTGSDWLRDSVITGRLKGHRVALIGGSREAGVRLSEMIPESLVFVESGDKASWDADNIAQELRHASVDVCIVAVTPPFGDIFASQVVEAGYSRSIIAVGGSVDMLVGIQARAPRLARRLRLEWLWRMLRDPKRLARRYLVECIPTYATMVLPQTIRNRLTNR